MVLTLIALKKKLKISLNKKRQYSTVLIVYTNIGDNMRTFFVFDIREEYIALYKDYEISLYNLLKQVYNLRKDNIIYGKQLLEQLVKPLDKEYLDRILFLKLHQDIPYSKRGHTHIYNNFYLAEISTLEIKHYYIKISSSKDYNYFFKGLNEKLPYLFACDFETGDYFFLNRVENT